MSQILLSQVVADARGVALATLTEALPYLKEERYISTDALGLLILEEVPAHLKGVASISSIRFPVTYLPTQDPLLIQGSLLQLGDHPVARKTIQDPVNMMDLTDTKVLKIRDELTTVRIKLRQRPFDIFSSWCLCSDSALKSLVIIIAAFFMRLW